MHDIWNPWHGCVRVSPGCANCYMYFLTGNVGRTAVISIARAVLIIRCSVTRPDGIVYNLVSSFASA